MYIFKKIWLKLSKIMNINDEIRKTEKELLEDALCELLIQNNDGIVISIKGSWGIGKSCFWHEFSKKFQDRKYAYVSLFGKTSLSDIKEEIILQVSSATTLVKKAKTYIGSSKLFGIDLSSSLSLLSKSDFKGITICFDDFERISSQIDIKDVIGLISELKEQKECRIVIINNNDQLEQSDILNNTRILKKSSKNKILETKYYISKSNNKHSFQVYSEKIIDYEFLYTPSLKENFNLFKDKIIGFDKDLILNFLEWTSAEDKIQKNFNLRILKKYINALNIFKSLENEKINKEIKDSISAYIFEKIYKKNIDTYVFSKANISSIHKDIDSALNKSFIINHEIILSKINTIEKNLNNSQIANKVHELNQRFNFDLSYSNNNFTHDLNKMFNESIIDIIKILGVESFLYYMNILLEICGANKEKYKLLVINAAKKYIDNLSSSNELFKNSLHSGLEYQFKEYPEVIQYMAEKKINYDSIIIKDKSSIIEILKKPKEQGGWSPKDEELLSSLSVLTHKKHMKESMDYLHEAFQFARWSSSFTGENPFDTAFNNIYMAIDQLSKENEENKFKMRNIISELEKRANK